MARSRMGRVALLLCSAAFVAACEKGGDFNFLQGGNKGEAEVGMTSSPSNSAVTIVERDVEAPEVFQATDKGLWDGRPSLGGVWVAHSNTTDPERVIIRNESNGKFVIGALFKRERENPGPALQVSSDAAAALGMLAGAPDTLNVTALRRQEVPLTEQADVSAELPTESSLPEAGAIETASLGDPIAAAGAALDKLENKETVQTASLSPVPPKASKPTSPLKMTKPYIQIGFYGVEENATNAGVSLTNAGILPNIEEQKSKGKTYFRVTVGPAPNALERAAMLKKVKSLGYSDAYFVTN